MSEWYYPGTDPIPHPSKLVEFQAAPGAPSGRCFAADVTWKNVHRWRYAAGEPCNDCAHCDVPPHAEPCKECLVGGKYANFMPAVPLDAALAVDPLATQVDGNHYKGLKIQPVEYIHANGIGYLEGNVIKYVTRHGAKNGAADVRKALHYCQLLLKLKYGGDA